MRASGGRGRGRATSRRRRPRALRAEAVWAEAAREAAAPQSRGFARASRSGNGRLRSGRGGPGGTARPRRCVPRGRRSLPGLGVAAAPGDAPSTGLRRGAAGVRTARTRAARCAAGRGGDQRRGRCSPRGPRARCPRRRSARPGPAGHAPPSSAGARSLPRLLRGAPGGSGPDPGLARERTHHKLCLLLFLAL